MNIRRQFGSKSAINALELDRSTRSKQQTVDKIRQVDTNIEKFLVDDSLTAGHTYRLR